MTTSSDILPSVHISWWRMRQNYFPQKTLPLALVLCICVIHAAHAQFTLSAEIRPRAEYRNGFKQPLSAASDPAFFVEQRTRLNTAFSSDNIEVFISFQDVRNWGSTPQVYKSDPSLQNLYAAWAMFKMNAKHSVAVGRMELDYDNVRILGNLDWAAQGRSHDLIKYVYKGEHATLHVGAAFNQDYTTPEPQKLNSTYYSVMNNYKTMQFAWLHKDWDNSKLSLLVLNNGAATAKVLNGITRADSVIHFSQTMGFYGTKKIGGASLEYDAYYQRGKNPAGKMLNAYMAGMNITFRNAKPNNFSLGVEYLTGDKSSTSDKDESFDSLYGTHHKFYGFMDYFYVGNGHQNKGLINGFVKSKFKTGVKSTLLAHAHEFISQSNILNGDNTEMSSTLGTEVDLVYALNPTPGVVLNIGYSHMFYTRSLEFVKGVAGARSSAAWAWAMITFKPVLFTTNTASTIDKSKP